MLTLMEIPCFIVLPVNSFMVKINVRTLIDQLGEYQHDQ